MALSAFLLGVSASTKATTAPPASRQHRERQRNGDATLQQRHATPPETETETETETEPPYPPRRGGGYAEDFEAFWQAYPKRKGKGNAFKAWTIAKKKYGYQNGELLSLCLTALQWQVNQESWTKDNGQFVPHPATWLNQARWEDEHFDPEEAKRKAIEDHDRKLRAELKAMEDAENGKI